MSPRLTQRERADRNKLIVDDYRNRRSTGDTIVEIARKYALSVSSIQKIVRTANPRQKKEGDGICVEAGCTHRAVARGRCRLHYHQWWRSNLSSDQQERLKKAHRKHQAKHLKRKKAAETIKN